MKKLQILVTQYKESDEIVKHLLDSISLQQGIDFNNIGVIICNDGSPETALSESLLNSYKFDINYYMEPHRGISGTRNACLDHSDAEYIMFCDADDMFLNNCGLYMIKDEMTKGQFDFLMSTFVEQKPITQDICAFINHEDDCTFVHGKVYRRQFLIDNDIRWNEDLIYHEDHYFNVLCLEYSTDTRNCKMPFYLWKYRFDSTVRDGGTYMLKTYPDWLKANAALVDELINRFKFGEAQFHVVKTIYSAYFDLDKPEWHDPKNKEYKEKAEQKVKWYYDKFQDIYDEVTAQRSWEILKIARDKITKQGKYLESITFYDWIKHIEEL